VEEREREREIKGYGISPSPFPEWEGEEREREREMIGDGLSPSPFAEWEGEGIRARARARPVAFDEALFLLPTQCPCGSHVFEVVLPPRQLSY